MIDLNHIRNIWDVVDQGQEKLDEKKWQIAEALWKASNEDLKTQQVIASEVGRNQRTVGRWIQVWKRRDDFRPRGLNFTEALAEIKGRKREDIRRSETKKHLKEAPIEEVEQIMTELPKARRAKLEKAFVDTSPALQVKPHNRKVREKSNAEKMSGYISELDKITMKIIVLFEKCDVDEQEVFASSINNVTTRIISIIKEWITDE